MPLTVIPFLPSTFGHREVSVPRDLIGATVERFGTTDTPTEGRLEGGGLVIDYRPAGSNATKQIIFEFTELGMWISDKHPSQGLSIAGGLAG